ncbi:MAG TPA: TonB-dependent receptor [Vicinamibacterales bacterium]|nr:TonB-dependent receptor [Vicinamibacterales bacterium]
MKRWSDTVWALAAVLLLVSAPAFAQGGGASSTGSISGDVKDAQGGVLPSVTVTASSPAQIGVLTAVTNDAGIYRFPSVPPGEYKLAFELAGFQNLVRDAVRITLGFNAQVNVSLGVATLNETVTVSGESPVIDTSATRVQTNYDQQALASIPNARDMWSLLSTTPSVTLNRVDVGGATMGTQTTYFAYGYSGQNRPLIEGINTTEGTAAAGFYLDYGSFEEVFIGAAANSAEMPNPGVLTQFVGKSGGNTLGISAYYDYENGDIQSRNLSADQVTPSVGAVIRPDGNRLAEYKNFNLGVGGPLLRDKVWGHFSYLNQQNSVAAPPAGSFLDGTPFNTKLLNYTGKATYQMNQNNKFIGYLQHGTKQQPNRTDSSNRLGAPVHLTADSTTLQDSPSWVYKGEWNGTLGQNMYAEFRAGQFGYNFGLNSNTDATRYEDLATNQIQGGGRHWLNKRRRNQYTGALSLFKDNFLGGSHNLKFGGEFLDESGNVMWEQGYADSVIHFTSNGVPNSVRLYNSSTSAQNGLYTTSAFVTDTWSIDRLTLNVGARFDRYRVWLPAQTTPASRFNPVARSYDEVSDVVTFNHIVPRIGATFNLTEDAQTVIKGNWGRFYFNPGVNLADAVNPNTSDQYADWNWADANGDRVYQNGEETTLITRVGGSAGAAIDPNLKNSYADETSVFLERALRADLGVRAGFVYKTDNDGWQRLNVLRPMSEFNVPLTIIDPGPDGSAATTADNGASIPGFNLSNTGLGSRQVTQNVDGYKGTYKTFELSTNKRYTQRWSLNASFSYSWSEEFGNIYFNNRFGTAVPGGAFSFFGSYPTNPNEQTRNEFTMWNAKVSGTADAGWGLRVTPVLKMQSGAPYGRFFATALNYNSSQIILAEPIGTRRQETVSVVDVRLEKQLRFADKARVGLFVDVFNVMNANTAVNINWRSGANFEKATTVLGPRIAKFGAKFDW